MWNPVELRTPSQATQFLKNNSEALFGGRGVVQTIPYSMPGTILFQDFSPAFLGPTNNRGYGPTWANTAQYGPVAVRGGVSAILQLSESGYQTISQDIPTYSFQMNLISLVPEIEYPLLDTSYFVTLAFVWDSDATEVNKEVYLLSDSGMASLLIVAVATCIKGLIGTYQLFRSVRDDADNK